MTPLISPTAALAAAFPTPRATWFDASRFVDGRADGHCDPQTLE
jgi:hypothetical protein